jgi:hypothetical protein
VPVANFYTLGPHPAEVAAPKLAEMVDSTLQNLEKVTLDSFNVLRPFPFESERYRLEKLILSMLDGFYWLHVMDASLLPHLGDELAKELQARKDFVRMLERAARDGGERSKRLVIVHQTSWLYLRGHLRHLKYYLSEATFIRCQKLICRVLAILRIHQRLECAEGSQINRFITKTLGSQFFRPLEGHSYGYVNLGSVYPLCG